MHTHNASEYPSIQAAIDAAEGNSNGGAVYIPAGVYHLENTLRISNSGLSIFGDGPDSTIHANAKLTASGSKADRWTATASRATTCPAT
ncbi:glycosyl hydrolase family 28-related protein [Methylobacterium durans]|uniref:Rhamnogalacturonase A/B/Epimerase-like pectate lyase domain-containing protein n=1 Tax=Methylobacterium durans TaxID=2202825 RepID=A0A2U8WDE6_9HYPH|nr:hypothetical protein DK389_26050 [Methylobacterium durans]